MKKIALMTLCIVGISISAKCDGIDWWYTYYNNIKKTECSEAGICSLTLSKDSLKDSDTIIIEYFNDSYCSYCYNAILADSTGKEIYKIEGSIYQHQPNAVTLSMPLGVIYRSHLTFLLFYSPIRNTHREGKYLL